MKEKRIPFNWPYMTGKEMHYISEAYSNGVLAGNGLFTQRCHNWLEKYTGCSSALLTHSCTAALEMAALLLEIKPGDEIIMPSYTFVSTANAFVLRGGVPVFVDIREDTLNLDEKLIEPAITSRTKAIIPVHYAGVSCEMDTILTIAEHYNLKVIEDAAQGVMASYKGYVLGSIGHLGTYSFHETKNVISGEGGALLVNDKEFSQRAEVIWEKGTNRSQFFRGEIDKYTWQEIGSSFLPGEMVAAFLWAQLEDAETITQKRMTNWLRYHEKLAHLETKGQLRRPIIPNECQHNAHMYYVLLAHHIDRQSVLNELNNNNISAVFHYVPLHLSQAGKKYGKTYQSLSVTEDIANRIIRLPLWTDITESQQDRVINLLSEIVSIQS